MFTTLHARTGYWRIYMQEASREKTAFAMMNGLYEFRVMPFGLCNSPATFQRLMWKTQAGLGVDMPFGNVYIDEVIVFSSSIQEHGDHLRQVFESLRKIELKLHPQKCQFACPEVLCLGHIISAKRYLPKSRNGASCAGVQSSFECEGCAGVS